MSLEGHQLGEFEILERLGQGGMGAVYKARQTSLDRFVAIKTLQTALADDPEYIVRFRQEAKAAAGLGHPNLVQVISAGESEGLHWFAMEYVEGESAKVRLKRKGRLKPSEAIAIAIHVATALEYGWRKPRLIHRDIKPDNIFLSTDGEVKLGDLGLAKSAGQAVGLTTTGQSMGTPHYISPEQVLAMKDVDPRADIYSLGCTLYHLLSGEPPFDGNSAVAIMMQHVHGPAPDLRTHWPECPAQLRAVVGKMMEKEPERRPQDYAELIADLRQAYHAKNDATVPAVIAVTQRKPANSPGAGKVRKPGAAAGKSKALVSMAIVVGVVVVGIGTFLWPRPITDKTAQDQGRANEQAAPGPPKDVAQADWHDLITEQRSTGELLDWATTQTGYVIPHGAGFDIYCAPAFHARNVVVRATWRNDFGLILQLRVRPNKTNDHKTRYECLVASDGVEMLFVDYADEEVRKRSLKKWPLPSHFDVTKEHTVVFQVRDDLLQVQMDGVEIGALRDQSINAAGQVGISPPDEAWIYKVEYASLDASRD